MAFKIAGVSFLNTIPLVEFFRTPEAPSVQLEMDLPSRLPERLASGNADVALIPVAEIFRGKAAGLLGSIGIVADGPVDSVKLFIHGPRRRVRTLLADRGSRTSVALARVLLAEEFGLMPDVQEIEPHPGDLPAPGQALLAIGDRCFAFEAGIPEDRKGEIRAVDLGGWWRDFTDLPFVFAAWAASRSFMDRETPESVLALKELLDRALEYGLANLDNLAAREAAAGKMGVGGEATPQAIGYYFRNSLRFRINDREIEGMKVFHQLCVKYGLVPSGGFPPIL